MNIEAKTAIEEQGHDKALQKAGILLSMSIFALTHQKYTTNHALIRCFMGKEKQLRNSFNLEKTAKTS